MLTVDFYELDEHCDDRKLGSIILDAGDLRCEPDSDALRSILQDELVIPDFLGGGLITTLDPPEWLDMLQYNYRSPYLRAMPPEDDDVTPLQSQFASQARKRQQESLIEGGAGSGNFGHAGRPGEVGGSEPGGGGGGAGPANHDAIIARPATSYQPINAGKAAHVQAHDTQHRFSDMKGGYTPERKELHNAIIGKMSDGLSVSKKPTVYMTGGGSASGKGWFIKSGPYAGMSNAMHIDPDAIKAQLPEYRDKKSQGDHTAAAFAHEESSDISAKALAHGTSHGFDVVSDTTGDSGIDKLEKKIGIMRAGGHQVVANYMTVDTDEAIRRSDKRAKESGREVPHKNIRDLHRVVSQVVPEAIKRGLFDQVTVWDNNGKAPVKIAVAKGKELHIIDQKAWDKFVAKGAGEKMPSNW